jgi:hypothetical protein
MPTARWWRRRGAPRSSARRADLKALESTEEEGFELVTVRGLHVECEVFH